MYDKLLRFSLFQGIGQEGLERLIAHTKLDFVKYPPGKVLLRKGDRPGRLMLLLDGTLLVETGPADAGYAIIEEVKPPFIIEAERLFGLHQSSRRTITAATTASLIAIDKAEVARLCDEFMAFRLNLTNTLANIAQQYSDTLWLSPPTNLRQRIIRFIACRCMTPFGRKEVHILMERLGIEVNDSRLDVSRVLHAIESDGLMSLGRGRITIPSMERLLSAT